MWPRAFTSTLLGLTLLVLPTTAQASQKIGTSCSKLGAVATYSGVHYRCVVSGKKLAWVRVSTPKKAVKGESSQTSTAKSKLHQSISAPNVKTVDIAAGKFTGVFLANSKLPVDLSSSTPLICSIKDQSIQLLQTGSCTISANQSGNDKYLPSQPVSYTFEIIPPVVTSDNALFDEVQTFVRVPMGTAFASDTAEITLTSFLNDATAEVCTNDPSAPGCLLSNGAGVADPASQTRYVEFKFHIKNLDANPLPSISYRLLMGGVISDIDTGVTLETLTKVDLEFGQTIDGSFFGLVPVNLNISHGYLIMDEGITDSSVKLLLSLSSQDL